MRVYLDTGVFIDFLSLHSNSIFRTTDRRIALQQQIAADAGRLFERVKRAHTGGTSCLTYYEAEEASYGQHRRSAKGVPQADRLLIPMARDNFPSSNIG
jgi:hypothetical protein